MKFINVQYNLHRPLDEIKGLWVLRGSEPVDDHEASNAHREDIAHHPMHILLCHVFLK